MEVYYKVVFFVFGLVLGSFYNVVAYRLPKGMSLTKPSSHCTKCNHKLSIMELIPVFSYLFLKGKCKKCGNKISIFYPIFELLTGILFLLTYIWFGISIDTFIILIFVSMILILVLSDILYMVIPDSLLIFCGLAIFLLKLFKNISIELIIIDMLIPFLVMFIFKLIGDFAFKRESLGGGDIKLMLVFGLVLGWEVSLFSIMLSCFIALPISIIMLTLKKLKNHELPFGPYLGIAGLVCVFMKIDVTVILKILGF